MTRLSRRSVLRVAGGAGLASLGLGNPTIVSAQTGGPVEWDRLLTSTADIGELQTGLIDGQITDRPSGIDNIDVPIAVGQRPSTTGQYLVINDPSTPANANLTAVEVASAGSWAQADNAVLVEDDAVVEEYTDSDIEVGEGGSWVPILDASAIPDSGVFRYGFEDNSDTTVTIDSWNDYDGAIVGGSFTTDSAIGSLALSMDANDDEVDTGFFYDDETQPISFSVWLKTSNSDGALLGARGTDSADSSPSHTSFDLASGNLGLYVDDPGDSNSELVSGTIPVNDGTYHHLVYVFDNPNDVGALYVDGAEDTSGTIHNDGTQDDISLHLNNRKNAAGTNQIGGTYDDARVYQKALTASEVSNLYNTGSI